MEIFRDCSFSSMYHEFTRGNVVSVSWKRGKPSRIRLCNIKKCYADERILWRWANCLDKEFRCDVGEPLIPLPLGVIDPLREHASMKGGVIVFMTANHTKVALCPSGKNFEATPYFYRTAEQIQYDYRRMEKFLLKALKRMPVQSSSRWGFSQSGAFTARFFLWCSRLESRPRRVIGGFEDKTSPIFRFLHAGKQLPALESIHSLRSFHVLSTGIEPVPLPSEGSIVSIQLREESVITWPVYLFFE